MSFFCEPPLDIIFIDFGTTWCQKARFGDPLGPPKIAQAVTKAFKKASSPLNFWGSWEVVAKKAVPATKKVPPAHQNAQKCNMFARCFQQISNVFLSQFLMTRSTSVTKTNLVYPPISPVSQQKKTCFSPLLSISQIMDHKLPTKKAKLINGVGGMRRSL